MDYRTQLQFAKKEIPTRAPAFLSASSLSEQNAILTKQFKSPKDQSNAVVSTRLGYAEQALGTTTTPFRPPEQQSSQIDIANQKLKDQIAVLSQIPGVAREAAQERQRLTEQAAKDLPLGDQKKYIDEGLIGFWQKLAVQFDAQHRLNDQQVSDTQKIARGYQESAVEGLRAETLIQAQQQVRERGGDVATAQRDIINQRAATAISTSRQQSILAEPAIAAAEGLARASYVSRAEEEKVKIANEAAVQTQDVLNLALLQGSAAYIKEAGSIDENARAQIRRRDAAAQGLEAGHQIQANTDELQIIAKQASLQGQGSDVIREQIELLRARQQIEQRYTALLPSEKDAIFASTAATIEGNAALAQTQQEQQRVNDLFHGIATTIDGELTNSIRNALIRTPAEAAEHLKHFWDEFRAGLKTTIADIESSLANALFIKPLTGSIAGAAGLGQVAQQYGTFGGVFTGAGGGGATPGAAAGEPISGSQLALNVNGLSSGASIFGATQGGNVFAPGNIISVLGTNQAVAGGPAATATTGTAGLSADQLQALLDAGTIPSAATTQTSAAPLEAFLGTITSAVTGAAAEPTPTASAQPSSTSPSVVVVPGGETAGATSLAPQQVLPAAAALTTGVAPAETGPVATTNANPIASPSVIAAALSSLGSGGGLLGTLASSPGFLPDWLSNIGSGGIFGAGGITGAINSFGANLGFAAPAVTSSLPNAVGNLGALSDAQLSSLAAADTASGGVNAGLLAPPA